MKKTLKNEKRWDEKNIRRAARVFLKAEKEKGALIRLLDDAVHWLAFLLVIFACIIVDFFHIPRAIADLWLRCSTRHYVRMAD